MIRVFADSFYYLALINPRDRAHARAVAFAETSQRMVITTEWSLTEVADGMAMRQNRSRTLLLLDTLRANTNTQIIAASAEWFDKGLALYRARPDKDWGLTDCISFAVMREFGLAEAITGDQHFIQAGFSALLAD